MADEVQVGKKARCGYKRKHPKRFMRKSDPCQSLPGTSSVPVSPVPVQTASNKKIALEAPSTSNRVDASTEDLHLIKLGSLQGAVSAFSCCGSPLTITEDRKNRRGLASNLSISCSVCGKSSAITDSYCQKDLEVNSKSVLAMRAIGKERIALETLWRDGHVTSYHKTSLSFA